MLRRAYAADRLRRYSKRRGDDWHRRSALIVITGRSDGSKAHTPRATRMPAHIAPRMQFRLAFLRLTHAAILGASARVYIAQDILLAPAMLSFAFV